jgi:hypothetical protein
MKDEHPHRSIGTLMASGLLVASCTSVDVFAEFSFHTFILLHLIIFVTGVFPHFIFLTLNSYFNVCIPFLSDEAENECLLELTTLYKNKVEILNMGLCVNLWLPHLYLK